MLPARDGFPKKVKPLVRLGEREMAAYCVLRGIDYIVEECPMAAGNRHLRYKDALNELEAASPGAKSTSSSASSLAAASTSPSTESDDTLGACDALRRAVLHARCARSAGSTERADAINAGGVHRAAAGTAPQ